MPRPTLTLDDLEVEEVDIGDARSAFSLLSTTTSAFESIHGQSPATTPKRSIARTSVQETFSNTLNRQQKPPTLILPQNSTFSGLPHSPSSPELIRKGGRKSISRSATLPRIAHFDGGQSKANAEIASLTIEPEVVAKVRRWILGIVLVDFDVDDGPVVIGTFPPLILFPKEAENIAFSAFPDSLQFDQGSQIHSFRIKEQETAVASEKRPASVDGFMYGFAHFTQRRDAQLKRGYAQTSVVILTHSQFPSLFTSLVSTFGPLFDKYGVPMLESACHNIATWPDPKPGSIVELGFLGSVFNVALPHSLDEQQLLPEPYDPALKLFASVAPMIPPPISLFEAALSHLWSIWECVVLCEPILVFGQSPSQTSQAIWWLRDLLRPIPFAGDFRPYFTIHDADHLSLVNKLPPKASLLLGVTNPFFERSCAHWPHILSLGQKSGNTGSKTSNDTVAGPKPGWKTSVHKRFISKDRELLKNLELCCKGGDQERRTATILLRQHFCSRTTQLLTPLNRYLQSLIPTPLEMDGARDQPRLKSFNSNQFLSSLKTYGSPLPFRSTSKRTEFYQRWLKTPSFGLWLAEQEKIVESILAERSAQQTQQH